MAYSIKELKLERDTFISVLSARKTGKSFLIADMIHYFLTDPQQKCDYLYVFSNTAGLQSGTNEQYSFIDPKAILPAKPEVMTNVIKKLMISQKQTKFKFKVLVVFDDIVVSKRYEIIELLASMGRHYGITAILSAQISNTVVSPTIRNNTSYLFWRRLTQNALKDNVFPIVGVAFENSEELWQTTQEHIDNYQFLFFNNDKDKSKDSLVLVKADSVPVGFKYRVIVPQEKKKKNSIFI